LFFFSNNDSNNHATSGNNKCIPVTIVSWSCTDRRVATAYENGLIKIWEPNHGTLLNELKVNLLINYSFFLKIIFFRNMKKLFLYLNVIQQMNVYYVQQDMMDF
jgi:hypothetical protein